MITNSCLVHSAAAQPAPAKLDLPELAALSGHRVELTIREDADPSWPQGWFDAIEGSIQDASFERAPQSPLDP